MATKTAVEAPRTNAWQIEPEKLILIDDEKSPLFDPRVNWPVDEGMVRDIMVNGVIEPVIIAKDGEALVVVDGRQRTKAAREANKRLAEAGKETIRVCCIIRRGCEADLFGVSISANEHRKDDSPLSKADKAQRLIAMGKTEAEVGISFGVTSATVKNWLVLSSLSAAVRKAVERGEITATAAAALAGLSVKEQGEKLEEMVAEGGKVTVARAKAKAKGTAPAKRMRGRKEILAKYEERPDWREALQWVLTGD